MCMFLSLVENHMPLCEVITEQRHGSQFAVFHTAKHIQTHSFENKVAVVWVFPHSVIVQTKRKKSFTHPHVTHHLYVGHKTKKIKANIRIFKEFCILCKA